MFSANARAGCRSDKDSSASACADNNPTSPTAIRYPALIPIRSSVNKRAAHEASLRIQAVQNSSASADVLPGEMPNRKGDLRVAEGIGVPGDIDRQLASPSVLLAN